MRGRWSRRGCMIIASIECEIRGDVCEESTSLLRSQRESSSFLGFKEPRKRILRLFRFFFRHFCTVHATAVDTVHSFRSVRSVLLRALRVSQLVHARFFRFLRNGLRDQGASRSERIPCSGFLCRQRCRRCRSIRSSSWRRCALRRLRDG